MQPVAIEQSEARIWELYPELVNVVKDSHVLYRLRGHHDIYHVACVGDIAYHIALETWGNERTARLSGIAGLCHNADRILGVDGESPSNDAVEELIRFWLGRTDVNPNAYDLIVHAVLAHDQENGERDSAVLIALRDADRIVNLRLDVVMRTAQLHNALPTVDYDHFTNSPTAVIKQPESVARVFEYVLEWVDPSSPFCIRTDAGMALARPRAKLLRGYLDNLQEQLQQDGIFPAPF